MLNHYKTLGVTRQATTEMVRRAFLGLSKKHHPDKGGDGEAYAEMTAAYAALGNERARARYEAELSLIADPCGVCGAEGSITRRLGPRLLRVTEICNTCHGAGFVARRR